MKAIETVYKGYRFRSRLEARWAVFFDALDIKYEYEPQGFDLGECGRYLPDFWLPTFGGGMFCEVKPVGGDLSKARDFCYVTHHPIWLCEGPPTFALYFVLEWRADTPNPSYVFASCGMPNTNEARGEDRMYVMPCELDCPKAICDARGYSEVPRRWDLEGNVAAGRYGMWTAQYTQAVYAARQARFEHGQVGPPKDWKQ